VIGSSDGHNSGSPVEEYATSASCRCSTAAPRSAWQGDAAARGTQHRPQVERLRPGGGLGEENTRDSLFDAMRRRETYATSGPRIRVRFFGG